MCHWRGARQIAVIVLLAVPALVTLSAQATDRNALAKRGDAAGAREEYRTALAIAPGSYWVKDVLLPAASK